MCGERSGDIILKRILRSLLLEEFKLGRNVCIPEEGLVDETNVLFNGPKDLGVMGFGLEVLKQIPIAYLRLKQTLQELQRSKPDVLLTVDAKGFCLRLQSQAAKTDWNMKRIHVCAPSSIWALRNGMERATRTPLLDGLFCVLPFEPYYWSICNPALPAKYVGYFGIESLLDATRVDCADPKMLEFNSPGDFKGSKHIFRPHEVPIHLPNSLLPELSSDARKAAKRRIAEQLFENNLNEDDPLLILAPGSRKSVVNDSLKIMHRVLEQLKKDHRKKFGVVVVASEDEYIASKVDQFSSDSSTKGIYVKSVGESRKHLILSAADASLVVSGTMVTELLSFQVPTVVVYNAGGKLTEWYLQRNALIKYASVCNIMTDRPLVPEFLFNKSQDFQAISNEIAPLLFEREAREEFMEPIKPMISSLVHWHEGKPVRPSAVAAHLVSQLCSSCAS